jgi:spore germination cell wall hydrolase CwlJ-like protein
MIAPLRIAACAAFLFSGTATMADVVEPELGSQVALLVGSERVALAALPATRVERLASARQRAAARSAAPVTAFDYSPATLAQMPPAQGGRQWECLTKALYFEARGESIPGQVAVAEVILNRVDHRAYPDTVCGVVSQGAATGAPCQFSFMCDGHAETVAENGAWRRAGKLARLLLDGAPRALTDGATYFHNTAVRPRWATRFTQTARIGAHLFYRDPDKTASN